MYSGDKKYACSNGNGAACRYLYRAIKKRVL
jgi:hypothetical protein